MLYGTYTDEQFETIQHYKQVMIASTRQLEDSKEEQRRLDPQAQQREANRRIKAEQNLKRRAKIDALKSLDRGMTA